METTQQRQAANRLNLDVIESAIRRSRERDDGYDYTARFDDVELADITTDTTRFYAVELDGTAAGLWYTATQAVDTGEVDEIGERISERVAVRTFVPWWRVVSVTARVVKPVERRADPEPY